MARQTKKTGGIGRREFVAGAGAVIGGTVTDLVVPAIGRASESQLRQAILHDPDSCAGCGVCGLMCSLYHEGEAGPILSRSELVRDPFTYDFTFHVCQQCPSPACYAACPLQGVARVIDDTTGTVYVNEDACVGCGRCVDACAFEPPRTKLHPETRVALNCDLCRQRDGGPICVEYCTMGALSVGTPRRPRPRRPSARYGHV
jgi:Fe-S-cluster-containing dehydrogenase component